MADSDDPFNELFGDESVQKGKMLSFVASLFPMVGCSAMY